MRSFDEILRELYLDYKSFHAELQELRAEGASDDDEVREYASTLDHPEYPEDPTEQVWYELATLAVAAFVSSATEELLDTYLKG